MISVFQVIIDEFEKIVEGYHTKTIDEDVDPETAANVLTDITCQGNINNGNGKGCNFLYIYSSFI